VGGVYMSGGYKMGYVCGKAFLNLCYIGDYIFIGLIWGYASLRRYNLKEFAYVPLEML
jgi:hypothetical protein